MDHKEQHHLKHEKEREHEKKEHERQEEKKLLPIHPAWLFGVALALMLLAVLLWTLFLS
jgi:hypothetical protein